MRAGPGRLLDATPVPCGTSAAVDPAAGPGGVGKHDVPLRLLPPSRLV